MHVKAIWNRVLKSCFELYTVLLYLEVIFVNREHVLNAMEGLVVQHLKQGGKPYRWTNEWTCSDVIASSTYDVIGLWHCPAAVYKISQNLKRINPASTYDGDHCGHAGSALVSVLWRLTLDGTHDSLCPLLDDDPRQCYCGMP